MTQQEVQNRYYSGTGQNSRMFLDLDSAVLANLYSTPPDKWEHMLYIKEFRESPQQVLPGVVLYGVDTQRLFVLAEEVCVDTIAWVTQHQPMWVEDTDVRNALRRLSAEVRVDNNTELHFAEKVT